MLEAIEIRRQIERRWPEKFQGMTDSELNVLAYEAVSAGERAVERLLRRRLEAPRV